MSVPSDSQSARPAAALGAFLRDVRHAWRGLWKAPSFAVVVVATLALGIGATTAIFSIVNAMLIAPLPYRDSSRLALIWSDMTAAGYPRAPLSGAELFDLRERSTLFTGFGAIWATAATLDGDGDPEQLRIGVVTANFFSVLGAEAAVGRTLAPEDEPQAGSPAHVVLSSALWRRRYGGDPTIVGRRIRMNGLSLTVVGVMPPDFRLLMPRDANVPEDLDLWMPFGRTLGQGPRTQQFLRVVGRMGAGVTVEQAQREIAGIAGDLSREHVEYGRSGRVLNVVALQRDGVREIRAPLLLLFGAVGILLVIACVNVANLLMARAASRSKETALRVALGAGRLQLLRQSVAEGLVLAVLGGGAGLIVGGWGLSMLIALRPESLNRIASTRIDPIVLIFTAGTAVAWGLVFSLGPVVVRWRTNVAGTLQRDARETRGTLHYRARAALVIAQIALGVILFVGAELMARTFLALQRVDPGFRTDAMLTFRVTPMGPRYRTPDAVNNFGRALQPKLAALPGVTGVGAATHVPFDRVSNWAGPYTVKANEPKATAPLADYRAIAPGYFEALGVHLMDGRFFTESDDNNGNPVAIVDEGLVRRLWPGQRAVGQQVAIDPDSTGRTARSVTIVGVVRHLRLYSLMEAGREQVYIPWRQIAWSPIVFVVRASGDPMALASAAKRAVAQVDPLLAVYDVRSFTDYVEKARATQRFTMILAASFAAVALALACVGVYGMMAYSVARRRHEFGVRLALGAQPAQLVGLVLNDGMKLTACGLAIGVVGGLAGGRLLQNQLFGVSAHDVTSYAIAVPILGACAVAACLIPAWRASVNSPLNALRSE
jgi:predicted permease